jgi:hypothetical protein
MNQPPIRLRSAEQFYQDQMIYKYKTESRLQAKREAELKKMCEPDLQPHQRKRSTSKGNPEDTNLVFDRLAKAPTGHSFKLDFAKLHKNNQVPTPRLTSSRSAEKLSRDLYSDAVQRRVRAEKI